MLFLSQPIICIKTILYHSAKYGMWLAPSSASSGPSPLPALLLSFPRATTDMGAAPPGRTSHPPHLPTNHHNPATQRPRRPVSRFFAKSVPAPLQFCAPKDVCLTGKTSVYKHCAFGKPWKGSWLLSKSNEGNWDEITVQHWIRKERNLVGSHRCSWWLTRHPKIKKRDDQGATCKPEGIPGSCVPCGIAVATTGLERRLSWPPAGGIGLSYGWLHLFALFIKNSTASIWNSKGIFPMKIIIHKTEYNH